MSAEPLSEARTSNDDSRWDEARRFFTALHGATPDGWIEIRPRPREGWQDCSEAEKELAWRHRRFVKTVDKAIDASQRAEAAGLNVLAGVALRADSGHRAWKEHKKGAGGMEHLLLTRAIYCDMDMSREEAAAKFRCFPLSPSMLVESSEGTGTHAYWILEEPLDLTGGEDVEVHEWHRNVITGLVQHVGGDPGAKDTARILRVPGTLNRVSRRKREAGRTDSPCILFQEDNGRRYTRGDFELYAEEGAAARAATAKRANIRWDGAVNPQDGTIPSAVQALLDSDPKVRARFERVASDTQRDTSASGTDFSLAMMLHHRGVGPTDIRQTLVASRVAARVRGEAIKLPDAQYYDRTVEEAVGKIVESERAKQQCRYAAVVHHLTGAPVSGMEIDALLATYPPKSLAPDSDTEQGLADWFAAKGMRNAAWVPGANGGNWALYEEGRFTKPSQANTAAAQHLFMTTVSGLQAISEQIPTIRVTGTDGQVEEQPDPLAEKFNKAVFGLHQRSRQGNVKALLKERRTRAAEEFDQTPGLVNLRNGVLEVESGRLLPHDPKYLHTHQLQADWNPHASVPEPWLRALERSFDQGTSEHTRDVLDVLQQLLGMTLLGDMPEKYVVYVYDEGNSGKTTLQEVLRGLFGDGHAVTIGYSALEKTARGGGGPNPEVDRLRTAQIVFVDEMTQDARIDPAMMKLLTGRGRMWSRGMYASGGEWHPRYLLWIAGNSLASIAYDEKALYQRLVIIKGRSISPHEQDTELKEKLSTPAARDGMLQWLWQGLVRWQESGKKLVLPEWLVQEREAAREDLDDLQGFVDVCLVAEEGAQVSKTDMYNAYRKWFDDSGQRGRPLNKKRFKELLGSRGHRLVKNANGMETWRDWALRKNDTSHGAGESEEAAL